MKKLAVGVVAILALLYAIYRLQVPDTSDADPKVVAAESAPEKPDELANRQDLGRTKSSANPSVSAGASGVESSRPATKTFPNGVLPAEANFVDGDTLESTRALTLLGSDRFSETLELLRAQAASDELASDVFQLYSATANRIAGGIEGVAIDDMACGRKICMGSMSGASQEQAITWADSIGDDPRTPILVFLNAKFKKENGETGRRFFFSSDPEINGAKASW